MTLRAQWSAPANLLLLGEYAVTRPGGAGISVALSPRGRLDLYEEDHSDTSFSSSPVYRGLPEGVAGQGSLTVTATMNSNENDHPRERREPLVEAVIDTVLAKESPEIDRNWHIEIDTSPFFDHRTGKKLGLGSSAVATLLLTTALLEILRMEGTTASTSASTSASTTGLPESPAFLEKTIRTAIEAHRRANDGRGSGYDIVTSGVGGSIRFIGGDSPQWSVTPFLSRLYDNGFSIHTWSNGPPVASGSAVGCFDTVIPPRSEAERAFLRQNNSIMDTMEAASNWKGLFSAFQKAARLSRDLGAKIGVSAELPYVGSHVDDGWISKASGAGNERGVIVTLPEPRRMLPRGTVQVTPELEGLTCLYRESRD